MRDQLADFAHHVEREKARAQAVDVLKKDYPVRALVHISRDVPILHNVKDLNRFVLGHPIVEF